MARRGRIAGSLAGVAAVGAAAVLALGWRSEIPATEPPAPTGFERASVERGAGLAAIGNCNVCHAAPGGAAFAGGRALQTPFGAIHATNITPDPDTGIGRWSEAAFDRAMREGVDREGRHLYPAFPYDHFTHVSPEDNRALYAYLMTREPVRAGAPANDLPFPLTVRAVLAGWKLLFFREGALAPDPARSEGWNRGRYLAEGLGHCGACHTPRNLFGAEERAQAFAGAEIDGWYAYAIDETSPAPVPWTAETLAGYLRRGYSETHGVSRGPMAPVTGNLGTVAEADVAALAEYVASRMGEPTPERLRRAEVVRAAAAGSAPGSPAPSGDSQTPSPATAATADAPSDAGGAIYAAACAGCHSGSRAVPLGGLNLHLSTAVNGPNPQNIVNVVLYGLPAPEGQSGPVMPGFAGALDEAQLTALLAYMRSTFSDKPAWEDAGERVRATLAGRTEVAIYRSDGIAPAVPGPETRTTPWP